MDSDNRIQSIAITPTVQRQTPQNDFGTVLARTAAEAIKTGANLVSGVAGGSPIVSAAVSGAQAVAAGVASAAASSGGVAVGGSSSGKGDSWDLLEAQKTLQEEGRSFNMAYLQLQDKMQQESRRDNAVSNIMKVQHDSAKAAINNIR